MRLCVTLEVERNVVVPLNYQHQLSSAIYHFLETADADYAQFLHTEGYAPLQKDKGGKISNEKDDRYHPSSFGSHPFQERRRFKLFTFSQLWAARSRVGQGRLHVLPGPVTWWVSSPLEKFLREFATGLLSAGMLRVGSTILPIAQVETLPTPDFRETMRFKCLSPIVAAVAENTSEKRWTRYLRPKDPAFSERVRANLLAKYSALHGTTPADDRLLLAFDTEYLAKHKGTKLITFKEIQIVGAFAPFILTGSIELIRIGYECGLGEKNAAGFGMVEVVNK
jgi:CRISPR-associated endoribonuclease Cas6